MPTSVLGRRSMAVRSVNRTRERVFFGGMTLLMIGTILLGFRQSYFPLDAKPEALSSWVVVLHGVLFSLFLVLFFVQVALISARRVQWHMKLGLVVYGLVAPMVLLGVVAAMDEVRRELASGKEFLPGIDTRTFSTVSVVGMVMFGTLMAWSYFARRRPDVHKRLALYATLSMMNAGIDRWPWAAWGASDSWALWVFTGFLLLPVVYDLISLHRVHWVTMFAVPFIWVLLRLEIPLGRTHVWHSAVDLMLRLLHF
jgi:hypothetical protein